MLVVAVQPRWSTVGLHLSAEVTYRSGVVDRYQRIAGVHFALQLKGDVEDGEGVRQG